MVVACVGELEVRLRGGQVSDCTGPCYNEEFGPHQSIVGSLPGGE